MPLRLLARRLLPAPVRARLNEWPGVSPAYWTARKTSRTYAQHYADARSRYAAEVSGALPAPRTPAQIGVEPITTGSLPGPIQLPGNYSALVDRIARDVADRLSWAANSWFHPMPSTTAARTADVEAVTRGEVITLKLKNPLGIDGLEEFCAAIVPEIERSVYGARALVDKVYVQRTFVSHHREQGSWAWHYDQHPLEILKLMLYLTDVDAATAPFTYLADASGRAIRASDNPLFGNSRISPAHIQSYIDRGCQPRAITGARGTAILFNDNIIHRATFAERGHRDILTLQLRPSTDRRVPYVDARWTGSFQHRDFNPAPDDIEPQDCGRDFGTPPASVHPASTL